MLISAVTSQCDKPLYGVRPCTWLRSDHFASSHLGSVPQYVHMSTCHKIGVPEQQFPPPQTTLESQDHRKVHTIISASGPRWSIMGYSSSAPSLFKTNFSGLLNSLGISRMMVLRVVHSGISCRRIHHLGAVAAFSFSLVTTILL